jgi:hypothetical protein
MAATIGNSTHSKPMAAIISLWSKAFCCFYYHGKRLNLVHGMPPYFIKRGDIYSLAENISYPKHVGKQGDDLKLKIEFEHNVSKKQYRIWMLIPVVFGLVLFLGATESYLKVNIFKVATKTEAIVTYSYISSNNRRKTNGVAVRFKYLVNENEYTSLDRPWWKRSTYRDGKNISVYYYDNDPNNAYVYHISYTMLFFSLLILGFMTIVFIQNEKR